MIGRISNLEINRSKHVENVDLEEENLCHREFWDAHLCVSTKVSELTLLDNIPGSLKHVGEVFTNLASFMTSFR